MVLLIKPTISKHRNNVLDCLQLWETDRDIW